MVPTLIHGSAADCALACAGSIAEPDHPININSPEANLGRAAHAACESIPMGLWPDIDRIAREYGVDPKGLGFLVHSAQQAWDEVAEHFPDPQVEVDVRGPVTIGRTDVLSATPAVLAFLDWKSGRVSDEHPGQLMAYADAARAQYWEPESGEILGVEVWLRDRELRVHRLNVDELNGFRRQMADQIKRAGTQWSPGPHCLFCQHVAGCEPREQYLRATCDAISITANGLAASRDKIASLWQRSRDLKRALAAYERAVDDALLEGPLDLGDGARLERRETTQDVINPQVAWPVLEELGLSEDQIAGTLTMSKGKILDAVRAELGEKPARGAVGRAKGQALLMLRGAGAVGSRTKVEKKIVRD